MAQKSITAREVLNRPAWTREFPLRDSKFLNNSGAITALLTTHAPNSALEQDQI